MAKKRTRPVGKTARKNIKQNIQTSEAKPKDDIFGFFKGKIEILGDIVSPVLTPEEWGDLYFDDNREPKRKTSPRAPRSRRLKLS
jgi:hypothetical protein